MVYNPKILAWGAIKSLYPEVTFDVLSPRERQLIIAKGSRAARFSCAGWCYTIQSDGAWSRDPIPRLIELTTLQNKNL